MGKPGVSGLRRVLDATKYSKQGIVAAWQNEAAFRQESVLALFLIPTGLWLGDNAIERSILVGSCILVLIVELLNSAIEALVDRVGDEFHVLSGRAKDMGSAAVLFSLLLVLLVWGMVVIDRVSGS